MYIVLFVSVSKPAPNWNGTAVVDGVFKDIKLSDYKGKYLVFFFYPLDLYAFYNIYISVLLTRKFNNRKLKEKST